MKQNSTDNKIIVWTDKWKMRICIDKLKIRISTNREREKRGVKIQ